MTDPYCKFTDVRKQFEHYSKIFEITKQNRLNDLLKAARTYEEQKMLERVCKGMVKISDMLESFELRQKTKELPLHSSEGVKT